MTYARAGELVEQLELEVNELMQQADEARWHITAERGDPEDAEAPWERFELTCSFLFSCTGYYRYDRGYTPEFEGTDRFQGRIVHPQFWTDDIDYAGKGNRSKSVSS